MGSDTSKQSLYKPPIKHSDKRLASRERLLNYQEERNQHHRSTHKDIGPSIQRGNKISDKLEDVHWARQFRITKPKLKRKSKRKLKRKSKHKSKRKSKRKSKLKRKRKSKLKRK